MRRTKNILLKSLLVAMLMSVIGLSVTSVQAQRLTNKVAIFATLDKVTATINRLEVPLNQTQKFGSLKITPRACYSRPATEQPKTTTFVEIDEIMLEGEEKRLFTGWMFAESPGLNAVEHPVFDVWLTGCGKPDPTTTSAAAPRRNLETGEVDEPPPQRRRRRFRR